MSRGVVDDDKVNFHVTLPHFTELPATPFQFLFLHAITTKQYPSNKTIPPKNYGQNIALETSREEAGCPAKDICGPEHH
jgi:hypothetical protein